MKVFLIKKFLPFRDHLARRALFQFEFVIQNFFQFLVSAHLTLLLAAHESEYETVRPRYLSSSPTHSGGFRCVFGGFGGLLTEPKDPIGPNSARSDEDQHCLERASLRKNNITVVLPRAVL